jgi:osomolarity two-component system phosphorelay intermediate protein YPD1
MRPQPIAASGTPKITPVEPEALADEATEEEVDEIPLPDPKDVPRDAAGIIDEDTLNQIREMDEDDEDGDEGGVGSREFSRSIVFGFFDQAEATFGQMQTAL